MITVDEARAIDGVNESQEIQKLLYKLGKISKNPKTYTLALGIAIKAWEAGYRAGLEAK